MRDGSRGTPLHKRGVLLAALGWPRDQRNESRLMGLSAVGVVLSILNLKRFLMEVLYYPKTCLAQSLHIKVIKTNVFSVSEYQVGFF